MFLLYMCRVIISHIGACPGCSGNPTTTTVYPSDEGAFIPIHTEKLVIVGSSQQPVASDAALAGISITVIIIDGVLTVIVSIFTIWLLYTLYVRNYVWRRRRRASECSSVYMHLVSPIYVLHDVCCSGCSSGCTGCPRYRSDCTLACDWFHFLEFFWGNTYQFIMMATINNTIL